MHYRQLITLFLAGCALQCSTGYAQATDVESGNLFKHLNSPQGQALLHPPAPVVAPPPAAPAPVDPLASLPAGMRKPSVLELNQVSLPMVPSARPASAQEQEAARVQVWKQQELDRQEKRRQIVAAQEAEARRPQVVVVQQPVQDPVVSGFLAIPRMLGYLLGRN